MPASKTKITETNDYGPPFPTGRAVFSAQTGRGRGRKRKGFARNGKITRKKAVHRLDIFRSMVYNVRKYVIVCPGRSAVPTVGGPSVRARAAVRSKK